MKKSFATWALAVAALWAGIASGIAQGTHMFEHPNILRLLALYSPSIALALAALIVGIWPANKIAKTEKKESASIAVTIEGMAKEPVDRKKGAVPTHIFLRAKLRLKEPGCAKVTNYRLELFKHGQCESANAEQPNDVANWEPIEWAFNPPRTFAFQPLTRELMRGEPVEGWLRFVSETPATIIPSCGVRLIVQTEHGSDFGEIEANPTMWNRNTLTIHPKGTT
jgi:hypothetical protein